MAEGDAMDNLAKQLEKTEISSSQPSDQADKQSKLRDKLSDIVEQQSLKEIAPQLPLDDPTDEQVDAPDTTSVTDILRELKLPYVGKSGMFSAVADSKNVGEGLSGKGGITDPIELGNLLEYLIGKYLHDKQEFKGNPTQIYAVSDEKFGSKAWELIQSKMIEPTAKQLEQPLVGYGAIGRADCILRRKDLPTIIIDFKWTAANYPNPSPGYALQLLLYQWMVGQQYKEGKGADMYLIRFCEKDKLMQLIPFNPPAEMQYTSGSTVTSYVEICNQFCMYYGYPKLGEVDEEISSEMNEKLSLN